MANQTKFVVYKDRGGYYRWRLIAGNGEIVGASEAYTERSSAKRAAERTQQIAYSAIIVEE
jgi:uncharacterized protein